MLQPVKLCHFLFFPNNFRNLNLKLKSAGNLNYKLHSSVDLIANVKLV